jgi:hypothetical protein
MLTLLGELRRGTSGIGVRGRASGSGCRRLSCRFFTFCRQSAGGDRVAGRRRGFVTSPRVER